MSDITSEDYKRGFILGMTMNPLMVTTETVASDTTPTQQSGSGLIVADGPSGLSDIKIVRSLILCSAGTEGG